MDIHHLSVMIIFAYCSSNVIHNILLMVRIGHLRDEYPFIFATLTKEM